MFFEEPTLWGLVPLVVFAITIFRGWHPLVSIGLSVLVGAVMAGMPPAQVAADIQESLGSFLAYVGLIILAGGGLGKVAERTGVARNIVRFIIDKVGADTPTKVIIGTGIASTVMVALLGTLAGANAIIAPVVIPIMAVAGVSSAVCAIIFQGFGATGLFLGPFTPPMVTLMGLTGLSYPQVVLFAGLPIAVVMWVTTFFYAKRILVPSLEKAAYSADVAGEFAVSAADEERSAAIPTAAFLITLLGFIVYGIIIEGGATFAIVVIVLTAIVTGLAGRLSGRELAEAFVEGARPLLWLFFAFVLFTPFLDYMEAMGGFTRIAELLEPYLDAGGASLFTILVAIFGIAGVPGAAVAQKQLMDELFGPLALSLGVPMTAWALVLLVGSQITSFLYPTGDTLGSMGLARSSDLRNMIIFGVVASIPPLIVVAIAAFVY